METTLYEFSGGFNQSLVYDFQLKRKQKTKPEIILHQEDPWLSLRKNKNLSQSSKCITWYHLSAIQDHWGTIQETVVTKTLFKIKLLKILNLFARFYFHKVDSPWCLSAASPLFCIHCSTFEDLLHAHVLLRIRLTTPCTWFHSLPFTFSHLYHSCFKRLWFGFSSYDHY